MNVAVATAAPKPRQAQLKLVQPSFVIVGLDDRDKPHASRFPAANFEQIESAAELMGMDVLKVESGPPCGFDRPASNRKVVCERQGVRAFVPFVGQDLYRKLEAYRPVARRKRVKASNEGNKPADDGRGVPRPAGDNAYAKAKATGKPLSGKHPQDWEKIAIGQIGLASEDRADGWWTAHLREVRLDGTFVLEWEDFPGLERFVCKPEKIALLHPAYDGK